MERLRREIIRFHAAKINLFDYRFFSFFTFTPIFDFEPKIKACLQPKTRPALYLRLLRHNFSTYWEIEIRNAYAYPNMSYKVVSQTNNNILAGKMQEFEEKFCENSARRVRRTRHADSKYAKSARAMPERSF